MSYWHRLRLVSALALAAIVLFVLLAAARREPAPPRTNSEFSFQ